MIKVNAKSKQIIINKVTNDEPNEATYKAIEKGIRLINDPNAKHYSSAKELFDDIFKSRDL